MSAHADTSASDTPTAAAQKLIRAHLSHGGSTLIVTNLYAFDFETLRVHLNPDGLGIGVDTCAREAVCICCDERTRRIYFKISDTDVDLSLMLWFRGTAPVATLLLGGTIDRVNILSMHQVHKRTARARAATKLRHPRDRVLRYHTIMVQMAPFAL